MPAYTFEIYLYGLMFDVLPYEEQLKIKEH